MKKLTVMLLSLLSLAANGQDTPYDRWTKTADSLFQQKKYLESANAYSKAFESLQWRGYAEDRYAAACAWAKANMRDSAFNQLFRLAERAKFEDHERIEKDGDLKSLHRDRRWKKLVEYVKSTKNRSDEIRRNPIVQKLETIFDEDQKYRTQSDWKKMLKADSANQIEVIKILDTKGWLGEDEIGKKANSALFLVIQHADLPVQEKYLPMMRKAVEDKKARMADLALLEDRVLMRNNKKQVYGSQLVKHQDGNWIIYPIEDPVNVDTRRLKIGLEPMAVYCSHFGITWNLEEHLQAQKEN